MQGAIPMSDAKIRRPKAETPKGFRDYFGAEVTERKAMLDAITGVYHRYGFDPLETSAVETVEALGKFLPDVDRPNEGVFGWQDEDADWLALRYDLTAPLARVAAVKVARNAADFNRPSLSRRKPSNAERGGIVTRPLTAAHLSLRVQAPGQSPTMLRSAHWADPATHPLARRDRPFPGRTGGKAGSA